MRRALYVILGAVILCFCVTGHAQNLLLNPGFETAAGYPIPNWSNTGIGPGFIPFNANNAVPPHGGLLDADHLDFGGGPDAGYIYQQVSVSAGDFRLTGWYICYSGGAEPASWHHLQFGIDPTGWMDWSAGSVVKGTDHQVRDGTWYKSANLDVTVPSAGTITVFCYSGMDADNAAWWAHAFDDMELLDITPAVTAWELY